MESDFEIGGKKFKLNQIDAIKQFHIARRVGPLLADLMPAINIKETKGFDKLSESEKWDALAKVAGPIMDGLSKLTDADSEHVLYGLLSSVEIQQPQGNWAKLSNGTMLLSQDLNLKFLLNVAGRAFMFNLSGFF